jgi:hypothetical protein
LVLQSERRRQLTDIDPGDIQNPISDAINLPKTSAQVTQEKISAREEFIDKLTTLLSISFGRCTKNPGRSGLIGQQRWFSISASLAQTLARLVSDLEYEKMRLDVEALKKRVLEANVRNNKRIAFSQSRHRLDRQTDTER